HRQRGLDVDKRVLGVAADAAADADVQRPAALLEQPRCAGVALAAGEQRPAHVALSDARVAVASHRLDDTDELVAEHAADGHAADLVHVQVGPAYPAGADPEQRLARPRLGDRMVVDPAERPGALECHRAHRPFSHRSSPTFTSASTTASTAPV